MSRYLWYRLSTLSTVAAVLFLAGEAAPAMGAPCYVVLDRSDNVIYQSTQPPVDLSSAGLAARDDLRKRGEVLINFDTSKCPLRKPSSANGKSEASVDEIVAGIRSYSLEGRNSDSGQASDTGSSSAADTPISSSIGH